MKNSLLAVSLSAVLSVVAGCATMSNPGNAAMAATSFGPVSVTEHRGDDDLLTAGLGLEGLRAMTAPAFADPENPTAEEVRRRAVWSNWRGIADLAPGGGYAELYGSVAPSPGREFQALARLPGAKQPHRVLVQVPDNFDQQARCVVLAPASGSRGVLGAIAVAGPWALPKGCAIAYTDKGAGSDYYDLDAGLGVQLDGTNGGPDAALAFQPEPAPATGIAFKHAHSGDNPEAHWGEHVRQSAEFALKILSEAFPDAAPFQFDNTRVIAVGISNGGGAVLQAAQSASAGDWLDAVVAAEPNVTVSGARPIYDYTTEAALLMPCALPVLGIPAMPTADAQCAALATAGLLQGETLGEQQQSAYEALRANGWTDEALRAGSISVAFDLWRSVAVTYASAYGRFPAGAHPCGYSFSAVTEAGTPRPATATERAAWSSEAAGIPPGAGVGIVAPAIDPANPTAGLQCLRALWNGQGADADRVRQGISELQVAPPAAGLPVMVIHGLDDGLIPPAFTSAPYVAAARNAGADVHHWQVRNAQHFDAFLGVPVYAGMYLPLLPYVYEALDRTWAHLESGSPMPADAVIATTPRGAGKPLQADHLAIPR
ncbi:D-(-)-3-hydroxybutyrate oligomer hydrolase [Lysobacter sp. A03]|uniref:D-(-)-3-hydroxybutyrate oligomer hydrolase n=1 Tax=Lysobacter sp. A03 TaxID=1199154 RepID=UPI0005B6BBF1|nr:D-(-)-3-hydroxybutyrate oligomer hydrolase [Lysobacter sp. A03]KIQ96288.1 D(-)-3-hydroxybutyrate oligomer hydrolase [Lysobacter sp. A03]